MSSAYNPPHWRRALSHKAIDERLTVKFLTIQMFCLIYLQKFAVPPPFQISAPLFIMVVSVLCMSMLHNIQFSMARCGLYFAFIGLCLISQVLAGGSASLSSFFYLIILYSLLTVTVELSADAYNTALDNFVKFMIFPAGIIIFQYGFERITGLRNPLNMNRILPSWVLLHGFIYEAPYHFGFSFTRPNGFFFLETSFASAFSASAAIIEMTYFKRPLLIALMLTATMLSLGGTGTLMLAIAAPFLLWRQTPRVAGIIFGIAVVAILIMSTAGFQIPLLSRLNEFNTPTSSGSGRLSIPAVQLISLLSDPSYIFSGTGAGSVPASFGSVWPILKLLKEYGMLSMASFIIFYLSGVLNRFNLPLTIALSITYHFTGGYLLNPIMVELVAIFCFIIKPAQPVLSADVARVVQPR